MIFGKNDLPFPIAAPLEWNGQGLRFQNLFDVQQRGNEGDSGRCENSIKVGEN